MQPPLRSSGEADIVERGGTVNALDPGKQTIVIDGAPYAFSAGSLRIHTALNRVSGSLSELKPGMQIRFSSTADASSNPPQVREVWVTSDVPRRLR